MKEIYDRIRNLREELGMSQGELASKMGYSSRSTIAKIEAGINDIPRAKLEAFALALNTTPSYLMGWTDEKSPPANDAQGGEKFDDFIARYHTLSPENQERMRGYLQALLDSQK